METPLSKHLSPWPEKRAPRTEQERHDFSEEQSAHLPKAGDAVHVSDDDLAAMKAAHAKRFNEELPRTETLMAVAHIGYRMALRDAPAVAKARDRLREALVTVKVNLMRNGLTPELENYISEQIKG